MLQTWVVSQTWQVVPLKPHASPPSPLKQLSLLSQQPEQLSELQR